MANDKPATFSKEDMTNMRRALNFRYYNDWVSGLLAEAGKHRRWFGAIHGMQDITVNGSRYESLVDLLLSLEERLDDWTKRDVPLTNTDTLDMMAAITLLEACRSGNMNGRNG